MLTLDKILSWNFWFNLRPGHLMPIYQYGLIAFTLALFIISIISYIKKQNKKRKKDTNLPFWRRLYYFSLTNACLGLMFLFFDYEMIPFFSSRFWYPTWGVVMIVWLYFTLILLKTVPAQIKNKEQEKNYKKYLPNNK
jgi:amino acid transporter